LGVVAGELDDGGELQNVVTVELRRRHSWVFFCNPKTSFWKKYEKGIP